MEQECSHKLTIGGLFQIGGVGGIKGKRVRFRVGFAKKLGNAIFKFHFLIGLLEYCENITTN